MNPTRVLEEHALLRDRLSHPNYAKYMQPFLDDVDRKGNSPSVVDPATGKGSGWHFCQREQARLNMAESYFVSKDMVQLSRWASASLDDDDTFRHDLWPTDYGFIWLDDALVSTEMWGRTVVTKAMSWGRAVANGQPGTMVVLYTDMNDDRDEVNVAIKNDALAANDWAKYEQMGRLHVHHIMWFGDGKRVGPAEIEVPQDWQRFADYDGLEGREIPGMAYTLAEVAPNDARFVLALLMLLNQTVTSVVREEADKRLGKRMRRMNLPSAVTVITLRRHDGSRRDGETEVEWQHRWLVRGHWRWQPYGKPDHSHTHQMGPVWSEKGRLVRLCETIGCSQHWERLYIAPFVKGPESAPFKVSQKVYSLSR